MKFPVVARVDPGLRDSRPGECFYCHQKVGSDHLGSCVTIVRDSHYGVWFQGKRIGSYSTTDPDDWDDDFCERHKNQGSWCCDNIIPSYVGAALPSSDDGCLCASIDLKIERRSSDPKRSA